MSNPKLREMIAILKPSGSWVIYPFHFSTDAGNSFKKIIPMKIYIDDLELLFMKVTNNGRLMYKVGLDE